MKKLISILFLSLMLLQAIPVLHFFSAQKEIFYVLIDEEKPDVKSYEKKDAKECLSLVQLAPEESSSKMLFTFLQEKNYASPLLEFLSPPPNVG